MPLERLAKQYEARKPILDYVSTVATFFAILIVLAVAAKHIALSEDNGPLNWFAWISLVQFLALTIWHYRVCVELTRALYQDLFGAARSRVSLVVAEVFSFVVILGSGVVFASAVLQAVQ